MAADSAESMTLHRADGFFEEGAQERVVGAAEDQGVGIEAALGGFGAEFVEVDFDDLGGDGDLRWGRRGLRSKGFRGLPGRGTVQPSSTRGTRRGQAFSMARRPRAWQAAEIGVALDGGFSGDDEDVAGFGGGAGGIRAGLDDAEDGDGDSVLNGVEGEGAGGVAGDDEELGALLADEEWALWAA